jgi:hypothetical protein
MERAMHLLKKITILLFLIGFISPAYAAVDSFDPTSCSVYSASEADGTDKETEEPKEEEEEEEPDCE